MDNAIETFGQIYTASRNAGLNSFDRYVAGFKIKNPEQAEKHLLEMLSKMSNEDKDKLREVIKYFIDISLFTTLSALEAGEASYKFELKMKDADGTTTALIANNIDNDLKHKYFKWVKAWGK